MQRMEGVEVPVVFVRFTANLVSYGLKQILDVDWPSPFPEPNGKAFDHTIALAAIIFRHRHVNEFNDKIAECQLYIFEDCAYTLEYVQGFIDDNFKGVAPIMEFIVYCAFVLDIAVCCVIEDKKEYIQEIVEETYDVYEDHIKPYFQIIGGWLAFVQVAQQYLEFVRDMRLYGALANGDAATATSSDSHEGASILNIEYHKDRANGSRASATCTSGGHDPSASAGSEMEFGPNDNVSDVSNSARCDDSASVPKVAQCEFATATDSQVAASIFSIEYRMSRKAPLNGSSLNGNGHSNSAGSADGNDSNASADANTDVGPNDKEANTRGSARENQSRFTDSAHENAARSSGRNYSDASADSNMEIDSNCKESDVNGSSSANYSHQTSSADANVTRNGDGSNSSASADSNMDVDPNDKETNVNNGCDDSRVFASVVDVYSLPSITGDINNTSVCGDSHVDVNVHDDNASSMSSSGVSNGVSDKSTSGVGNGVSDKSTNGVRDYPDKNASRVSDDSNMIAVESTMMTPK